MTTPVSAATPASAIKPTATLGREEKAFAFGDAKEIGQPGTLDVNVGGEDGRQVAVEARMFLQLP